MGFETPKGTSLRQTTLFDVFWAKIGACASAVAFLKHPPPPQNSGYFVPRGAKSRMHWNKTPELI